MLDDSAASFSELPDHGLEKARVCRRPAVSWIAHVNVQDGRALFVRFQSPASMIYSGLIGIAEPWPRTVSPVKAQELMIGVASGMGRLRSRDGPRNLGRSADL